MPVGLTTPSSKVDAGAQKKAFNMYLMSESMELESHYWSYQTKKSKILIVKSFEDLE